MAAPSQRPGAKRVSRPVASGSGRTKSRGAKQATGESGAEPTAQSLRDQRRREKDRVSRNHILDAAERVFGQKGFHSATLKEVADLSEFSVGALYAFFEGKEDLFAQVLDRQGRALLASMEQAVEGVESPREQLHRVVDASIAYFKERPDFYRVFQRELGGATWSMRASLNEAGFERYREVMAFEEQIFAAGVEAGEFPEEDPEILAALFSGMVQAYIAQWVFGLEGDGVSRVDELFPVEKLHAMIDRAFQP
ncbi:MAG: TetR/AcrR family transcriptional regulator [Acidimicrobiales bacterium]|nr:TetR/AcrR family transcriptional regulator [Acidimicrobiales bacterium]